MTSRRDRPFVVFRLRDEDDGEPAVNEVVVDVPPGRQNETRAAEIDTHRDAVDGQPTFESDKEKECWALFKKMTAKGVSVTFDTVLRLENIDPRSANLPFYTASRLPRGCVVSGEC